MTGKKKEQSVGEAGIGQDIADKAEKIARATPQTKAGAVASTVKNAAKWLAGKGGPGREGPTYEGAEDIEDRGEYDREGDMAKDNIHTIVRNAQELESILGDNDNLPEWVQDKLANIKGMMTAVSEYMQTQHERDYSAVQKKSSKEVAEHGGGIGPKQHWQDLMPEGYQDFNKVEPYAVCLAGKPVKKFDYYEDARRFHDNWKKKLYREGDMAKAEKITLMPLNLDENETPNVKLELLKLYNKAMKAPAGSPVQKRIIAQIDALRKQEVNEVETDYQKRRQRERDVDAGKPVAKQRQPKQTDYQKRRAQDKKDMELGEEKTRLDPKCWTGKKIGNPKTKMKGGVRVNNCVPAESVAEDIYMEEEPSPVESAIIRRIMVAHLDWLQKFGPEKVDRKSVV